MFLCCDIRRSDISSWRKPRGKELIIVGSNTLFFTECDPGPIVTDNIWFQTFVTPEKNHRFKWQQLFHLHQSTQGIYIYII